MPAFRISVIGLGLMGGSMAYALAGFKNAVITGMDIDRRVCALAETQGAVSHATDDFQTAITDADLVIFCVYPHVIPALISEYSDCFQKNTVITDICGVKSPLYEKLSPILPKTVDYIGIHPMAGKEVDGFENSQASLFRGTGFIITPLPSTTSESIALMRSLAEYIGAVRITVNTPELHDAIIAYTSDLMHISASALCINYNPEMTLTHCAGAFRDCTRVANINAEAWTELLMSNRTNTLHALDKYIESLQYIRGAIAQNDSVELLQLLQQAAKNKKEIQSR